MADQTSLEYKEFEKQHLPNLFKYVIAIASVDENGSESIGSGVLINLKGRHFIASARHCIERDPGVETLKSAKDGSERFVFPVLDQRKGGDPSWANTLDSLRTPRETDQTFWDWRRESAIRPIVFDDPGTMTDEVVHLHLEHRVVKRLLGRFTAQGFVYHDYATPALGHRVDLGFARPDSRGTGTCGLAADGSIQKGGNSLFGAGRSGGGEALAA